MPRVPPDPLSAADRARLSAALAGCWERAQAHWSRFLLLSAPVDDREPTIAQIHLGTRQIAVNFATLVERKLEDCLEAILAHEIGHHVRYPGSLGVQARLWLIERALIPIRDYSLINLFTDLLINERLGHALRAQLVRVYAAFTDELMVFGEARGTGEAGGEGAKADGQEVRKLGQKARKRQEKKEAREADRPPAPVPPAKPTSGPLWKRDPAFVFYLSLYEELWRQEPGTLMGRAREEFEQIYPDYRAEAQVAVQNLFSLAPNIFTQFIYFLSVMSRYIEPRAGETPQGVDPCRCGKGEPSDEDWADALTPSAREREAIERAVREGWISSDQGSKAGGLRSLEDRIAGLPGQGTDNAQRVPEIMAAYYRMQAENYLIRPPAQRSVGEAAVPTTPEEWEPGDAVRDIDWLMTLSQRGELLGSAAPLKRTPIAEVEGFDVPLWQPRVEIYLDVSGSMPDPRRSLNAMTLAAQILVAGSMRAGGWVRALLYSGEPVTYWQWCRSETELSRFLMHYVGGGTEFPFDILRRSVEECGGRQPVRVVISDSDFDRNYDASKAHAEVFARAAQAAQASAPLVLLLHRPDADAVRVYRSAGAKVVTIERMTDFPKMAADLAFTLFPDGPRAPR